MKTNIEGAINIPEAKRMIEVLHTKIGEGFEQLSKEGDKTSQSAFETGMLYIIGELVSITVFNIKKNCSQVENEKFAFNMALNKIVQDKLAK